MLCQDDRYKSARVYDDRYKPAGVYDDRYKMASVYDDRYNPARVRPERNTHRASRVTKKRPYSRKNTAFLHLQYY